MNCPQCNQKLPDYILRMEYDGAGFCPSCGFELKPGEIEGDLCPMVQDMYFGEEDFDPEECADCEFSPCIFVFSLEDWEDDIFTDF